MADLLFEYEGTTPAGDAVALLFGEAPGEVLPIEIVVAAVVGVLAAISVEVPEVAALPRSAGVAWGATTAARPRPAGAAWGASTPSPRARPARVVWTDFDGFALPRPAGAAWGATTAARPRPAGTAWGASTGRSVPGGAAWALADGRSRPGGLPWAEAGRLGRPLEAVWGDMLRRLRRLEAPWGAAARVTAPNRPLPSDAPPIGFVPPAGGLVHMHFCVPTADDSLDLVLGRENCLTLPRIPDGTAIASRRTYMQSHSLLAHRLPDLAPVVLTDFTLSADSDSFGWTLQASGPIDLLTQLAPVAGVPTGLRLTVDGMTWEFVVEGLRRNRAFGSWSASFTARSAGVLLAEPYSLETSYLNAVPVTAVQIIEEALFGTGVALDWQCTDWTVPAGAWTFRGTPLAVARRVADSIGALLQSPRAGDEIIVAPRYVVPPWEWAGAVPDITLALDAVVTEGYERADRPAYEGIYVSGQGQGVLALVKRTGTAPSLLMTTETDPLLTHLDATRQRGIARLGTAGPQARMTISLPVLTGPGEPGVIDPGKLVLVNDPAGAWKGVVRSTSVSASPPELRQTLTLERHL